MNRIANLAPLKSFVLAVALLGTSLSRAQLTDVVGKRIHLDKVYSGFLANAPFELQQTTHLPSFSIQMGVRIGWWVVPEKLKIRSFGVYQRVSGQNQRFLKSYEAIINPTEALEIKIGVMATPTTELRPNPLTWQSQVETNAESTIPGGQPGIKVRYLFQEGLGLTYGMHGHDGNVLHHLKITYKKWAISSFVGNQEFLLAARWNFSEGTIVFTRNYTQTALSILFPLTSRYKLYSDMEYDGTTKQFVFGEWGFRKHFNKIRVLNGFFLLNYNSQVRAVQGGVFVHI